MSLPKIITTATLVLAASASTAFAGAALTTRATALYEGPVAGAEIVATVSPGARLGVLWCGMHGQWCLVTYHAKQGFVSPAMLKQIGGQLAVGSASVTGGGGNGLRSSGPASGTSSLHLVTGAGSMSLGSSGSPGSTSAATIAATTVHPH